MRHTIPALLLLTALQLPGLCADAELPSLAAASMSRAVAYLTEEIAVGGGYLGSYKIDLQTGEFVDQWGEGHATADQNWVQPPGNPSVGFAFLQAWEASGEQQYLDAAVECADSLVYGQLACGGWDYIVDHSAQGEKQWYYRHNMGSDDESKTKGRNQATFDDDVTQHCTRLLMAVDNALEQRDESIHGAAMAALEFILQAQFDHGGWPQRFPLSEKGYSRYSTFNDNSIADCIDVMMIAWGQYGDQRYYDAILKAGQFILDAQLPEPQATWAQQYDEDLKPAWARRFEPPAACAGESIGVMRTLITIALFTGDGKYLRPLPAAFDWYKRSELGALTGRDAGKWARFYELGTNKPLYFTRDTYWLTYDDSDMPTHYSFKANWNPASVERQYAAITEQGLAAYAQAQKPKPLSAEDKLRLAEGMQADVRKIIEAQSAGGWWAKGDMIEMEVFERNIQTLARYVGYVRRR